MKTCCSCGKVRPRNWREHNRKHGTGWHGLRLGNAPSHWTCCQSADWLWAHAEDVRDGHEKCTANAGREARTARAGKDS